MIRSLLTVSGLAFASLTGCDMYMGDQPSGFFGFPSPGPRIEVFAPGVVSLDNQMEMGCAVSPDGKEFYFCRAAPTGPDVAIWVVREEDGKLTEPEVASFSGVFRDFSPFVTPDGEHMIFYRDSFEEAETRRGSWIVDREGDSWGEPRYLVDEYCVTTPDLRTFYFNFAPGAENTHEAPEEARELGMRSFEDGAFSEPMSLEGDINSPMWDAHGYISSDGGLIVYDSTRSGGYDEFDMYVSFRSPDGKWSKGYNLGEKINRGHRSMPVLSADGKHLFFSAGGDIWWTSTRIIDQLRSQWACDPAGEDE